MVLTMATDEEFERWMKLSEWRGKTVRALEDIDNELNSIGNKLNNMNKKIDKVDDKLTNQSIKVGIVSGTLGLISGLIVSIVFNVVLS